MDIRLKITDQDKVIEKIVPEGELLLNALQDAGTTIHAPCGGNGSCKKCKVEIEGVGEVLACQTRIEKLFCLQNTEEMNVILPKQRNARIQAGGLVPVCDLAPLLFPETRVFPKPDITDQRPDDARVHETTGYTIPFHLMPALPGSLRGHGYEMQFLRRRDKNEITFLQAGNSPMKFHGVSIDIGTTTLAAYLYDLADGKLMKTASCLNPQKGYGADVISRIDYASQSAENLFKLQKCITEKIMDLLFDLSDSIRDIKIVSIAGNTTMMHLLCGINPAAIATAPFIPVTLTSRICYAREIFPGLTHEIDFDPVCILLPSISGYVGADITAGILTCNMDLDEKAQILIDIGTNGEIAMSCSGRIIACSTAAGPAFEGASITCGMGGVSGAIDKVFYRNRVIEFTTISGESPVGICGSGIVAAVAALLESGVIDETGRFEDELEQIPEPLRKNITKIKNEMAYVFVSNEEGIPQVYLTQKDIREIQNAKAAVCAGIRLMIEQSGFTPADIENVYIAGGFGNFLDVGHAFSIGLLPGELRGKAKMVGNTSGTGASLCLLNYEMIERSEKISRKAVYYELSSDKRFTDLYIDAMLFET